MKFQWYDYNFYDHASIDEWCGNEQIKRFACDGTWGEEWQYYLDTEEYKVGIEVVCKVVCFNEEIIAAMIIFCNPNYPVAINPIIVNPQKHNTGYGQRIIREFIDNIDDILPQHSNIVVVGIEIDNKASIRMFEKCGFVLDRVHPSGDFFDYKYELNTVH